MALFLGVWSVWAGHEEMETKGAEPQSRRATERGQVLNLRVFLARKLATGAYLLI